MGIKISAFPPAATLTGAELVPIVQDGGTARTAASAFKTTSATDLVTGTLKGISVSYLKEITTVVASAASGDSPVILSVTAQPTLYYTGEATGNWVLNITGANGGATLDSLMSVNQAVTVTFINTNGATAYYVPTESLQIDGSTANRVVKWINGSAFVGNINSTDAWTFTIIKIASNVFTVLGSLTKFA